MGSLEKELNLELILFLLTLLPPALSVGMGSLEKELYKSNGYVVLIIISNHQYCEFFGWQFVW